MISLFLGIATLSFSQDEKIYPVAQEMPTLEACAKITDFTERRTCTDDKIEALLAEHLEYPEVAKVAGVDGFVIVRFVVDEKGKAMNHTVDEDPGYGMGEAALKAVKKFGKWVPGKNRGVAVKVRMTIPVKFKMPQEVNDPAPVVLDVYDVAERMPRYQGCDVTDDAEARNCTYQSLSKYMRANLVYPEEAGKQNIEGTVVVKFIVNETGMVSDIEVEEGIGGGCDEEAIRLVKTMPLWTPGMQAGKPVKVRLKLPFQFAATKKDNSN